MTALAVVPSPAVTAASLYVIEDQLAALIETARRVGFSGPRTGLSGGVSGGADCGGRETRPGGPVPDAPGAADRLCEARGGASEGA